MQTITSDTLRSAARKRGIGSSELARIAGLSRATVSKIMNGSARRVHTRTARKLAEALALSPNVLDKNHVATEYLGQVREQYRHLERRGLGIVIANKVVAMEEGFVPLLLWPQDLDENCRERRTGHPPTSSGSQLITPTRQPLLGVDEALSRSTHAFVLGEPGSGKTTLVRYLALQMASDACQGKSDRVIPVRVRLSIWADLLAIDDEISAFHAAARDLQLDNRQDTLSWLDRCANNGHVMFLFDGLDEVADPDKRPLLLEKLRETVRQYPRANMLISSRPVGFERPALGTHFDIYEIQRLDRRAIDEFVARWCSSRHGHAKERKCAECGTKTEALRRAMAGHKRITTLASNPMMLTILCLLHEAGAALPRRRIELYERIVQAFLFTWEQAKSNAATGEPDRNLALDDRDVLWLLQAIAFDMQMHDWTLVPRWWLISRSTGFLQQELGYEGDQARAVSETLLRSIEERAGILVERGQDRFGFQHLAFQEYFAARAVLEAGDPIEVLRPYLYHPRWREVVRLVAGDMKRDQAPQLLRVILDDPDPTGRFLRRGLLLALGSLADGAAVYHSGLLDQIKHDVIELGSSRWLGIPLQAISLLAELLGTRLEAFALDAFRSLYDRSRKELEQPEWITILMHALRTRFVDTLSDDAGIQIVNQSRQNGPIVEIQTESGDGALMLCELPAKYDAAWGKKAMMQLTNDASGSIRAAAAGILAHFANSEECVREALLARFDVDADERVRESIANGLSVAIRHPRVSKAILARLQDRGEHEEVRAACAAALRPLAPESQSIVEILKTLFHNTQASVVRAGVVRGVSGCVANDSSLRASLMATLKDSSTDERTRVACVHVLDQLLPSLENGIATTVEFLAIGSESRLSRVAAQLLADYAATGRVHWHDLPIERIEQVLVSVSDPCPHAFRALRSLVDAREVRRLGLSREARLKRAFEDYRERIQALFVFGSTARDEQGADSDIDLLLIGDVALREVTPAIKQAEAELGRQVNIVLYTPDEWEQKKDERNPFVSRVRRAEKKFVIGQESDLGTVVEQ